VKLHISSKMKCTGRKFNAGANFQKVNIVGVQNRGGVRQSTQAYEQLHIILPSASLKRKQGV
jgi:hypothetical protein